MDTSTEGWRAERRARILEAAARVFSQHSYEAASMDEIAAEAGFGKPTLYRYFPGKDALFAAVFEEVLDDLERRLASASDPETGAEVQLAALSAELVPLFREHFVSAGLVGEAAEAHQSKRRSFRERRTRIGAYLARAIEAGVRRGELRPVDGERVARLLIGMVWSATAAGGSEREIAREVVDLALNGLAPSIRRNVVWPPAGARPGKGLDALASGPRGEAA